MIDTYQILGELEVPQCAKGYLASQISQGENFTPILVGHNTIVSGPMDYIPVMNMSFQKDGKDYIQRVHTAVNEPFVAESYRYRCDGHYGAVAYMPKCQNLGVLEIRDPMIAVTPDNHAYVILGIPGITNFNNGGGGGGRDTVVVDSNGNQVPEPGTLIVLVVGLLALFLSRLMQKRCQRARE